MSTRIIYKQPVVDPAELNTAYIRALAGQSNAAHALPFTLERFDAEYVAFVENGRQPTGGFGHHRDNTNRRDGKYDHFSYHVVEGAA